MSRNRDWRGWYARSPKSTDVSQTIHHLIDAALASADDGERLKLVVDAWRMIRAPVLANAADAISEAIWAGKRKLSGRNHEHRQMRWNQAFDDADAKELGRLLASLTNVSRPMVTQRIRRLAQGLPDPRIATAMIQLIQRPPFRSPYSRDFWQAVTAALEAQADSRSASALEAIDESWLDSFRPTMRPWIGEHMAQARARIHAACAMVAHQLPAELARRVTDELGARGSARGDQLTALFELIAADPESYEARLIYADLLQEHDDPRGEFIALQNIEEPTAAQTARAEALLAAHHKDWLGPMAHAIQPGSAVWRRGFVESCAAWSRSKREAALSMGHPEWATVRSITMAAPRVTGAVGVRPLDVVLHPGLRNLRSLDGLEPREVKRACRASRPLPLTRLGFPWQPRPVKLITKPLAETAALPHLTRIALTIASAEPSALEWFGDLCKRREQAGNPAISGLDLELHGNGPKIICRVELLYKDNAFSAKSIRYRGQHGEILARRACLGLGIDGEPRATGPGSPTE